MEVSDSLPLELTSTVVHPTADGNYPFHLIGFLIPHEMLRRELTRVELALQHGLKDTYLHPWKVIALKEWVFDFFLPLLSTHHYIEDNIIFPFYMSLNAIVPERHSEDHLTLLSRMNRVKLAIEGLMGLVQGEDRLGRGKDADSSVHSKDAQMSDWEPERIAKVLRVVRKQEELVKEELLNLADNMRSHFSEEEAFWPSLLEQCGEGNWAKVEQLIINYTLHFGESNAGDPYRMMICAISQSMGIHIPYQPDHHRRGLLDRALGKPLDCTQPGCRQVASNTRWASLDIQRNYIQTRPYLVRHWKIVDWNKRFMDYVHLLESIGITADCHSTSIPQQLLVTTTDKQKQFADDTQQHIHRPPKHIQRNASTGKFVSKLHKTPVYLVLFFILSAFYSLIVGPYFAALSNPLRNIPNLHIYVVDFDQDYVGQQLLSFTETYKTTHENIPTLQIIPYQSDRDLSPAELRDHILDQDCWGAIFVHPNATQTLLDVFHNGCLDGQGNVVTEDGLPKILTFAWDEGRNSIVASPNIGAFSRSFLRDFEVQLSANMLRKLHNTTMANSGGATTVMDACINNGAYAILPHPLRYQEDNLTPISVSPVANSAGITVGSIYVAVFGANFIVGAVYGNSGPLMEDLSPYGKVGLRVGTFMLLTLGLSVCYSTLLVGLTADGSSGVILSGNTWAQMCASQWLHMMIWSFGHAWAVEALGFVLMPFFAAFFLLASITGGWNTDLADPGYKAFFQIFPFNWSINIMRYVVFKSCRTKVLASGFVLCAYWLTVFVGFIRCALSNELVKVSDRSLMKSKYSAPRASGTLLLRDVSSWWGGGSVSASPKRFTVSPEDSSNQTVDDEETVLATPYNREDGVEVYTAVGGGEDEEDNLCEITASMKPLSIDEV